MRRLAALTAALGLLLVLPATAQASQTLTVEKQGTGTVVSSPAGINCGATCSSSFADNTAVILTGSPGANAAAVKWTGCDSVNVENKCKVTMSAAKTVTATFDLLKRKLTLTKLGTGTGTVKSSPAGIDCGSECSAEYDHGTEVTLTATPGANTDAVKWTGCTSVDGENHCKMTMSAAKTVTATFNLAKRELKVVKGGLGTGTVTSSPAGINCGTTCTASYDHGTTVTLTATPGANTLPASWSGCDSVSAENKCLLTINAAREVTAVFNVEGPTLTIARAGSGAGTVTSSPTGIECGSACAVNFVKGTPVTLTGTPGLHSQAVKWAGCDEVSKDNKCVVTMSAAREVSAVFSLEPQWVEYTLSLQRIGTGQGTVTSIPTGIACPEDCSGQYVFKSAVTLVATPAPGSEFDHWSVTSCSSSTFCSITVKSSRTVNAVFVAVGSRTLTVAKAGTGQGVVRSANVAGIECGSACAAELDAKTKVVLTATPQAGSTFTGWSGEGCAGIKNCRLTMNEARNVTATFAKNPPVPSVLSIGARAKVRKGRALVRIACNGETSCRGTLRLKAKLGKRSLTIGSAPYGLSAGGSVTLRIKLSSKALAALRRTGALKARASGPGIGTSPVRIG